MNKYCLVKDGAIVKYNVAQKNTGLGVNSPIETYIAKGWYPLEDNQPAIDNATQRVSGSTYEVQADKVVKVYSVIDIPEEELLQTKVKTVESAIQAHINATVTAKGYDDENSIAKYLIEGNPFYLECKAISLWIGSVWAYLHQVQADTLSGTRTEPTLEELVAELPELVV